MEIDKNTKRAFLLDDKEVRDFVENNLSDAREDALIQELESRGMKVLYDGRVYGVLTIKDGNVDLGDNDSLVIFSDVNRRDDYMKTLPYNSENFVTDFESDIE